MATFRAQNVGLLFALAEEGFVPAGPERVTHPSLGGRKARSAFNKAFVKAEASARAEGLGAMNCMDDRCDCKGFNPFKEHPYHSRDYQKLMRNHK